MARRIWTALAGDVIKDSHGRAVGARGIDQDITERKNWEKRQASLLRELSHRVKNTLAVFQSVARQTLLEPDAARVRRCLRRPHPQPCHFTQHADRS